MSSSSDKPRMLFLHGMMLPPIVYTEKLATAWFDTAKDWEHCLVKSPRKCMDKPHPIIIEIMKDFPEHADDLPEWLNSQKHDDGTKTYYGLQESLTFLQTYLKEQPRFDIVAGHSNGALMASILTLMMEADKDWLPADKHWKATVHFNASASYETEVYLGKIVKEHGPIQTPSVHVLGGPTDAAYSGGQELQKKIHPTGTIVEHNAGHFFPNDSTCYEEIVSALKKMTK